MFKKLLNLQSYSTVVLIVIAVIGDYMVGHAKLHERRALFDNATHAAIGAISWLIVSITAKTRSSLCTIVEILGCTLLSSFIDLDHFLVAHSLNLKDAVSLERRPPLHCSSVPLVFCILLYILGYMIRIRCLLNLSLIIFIAFGSHHTRDATRRGFWFYPFGSTPPIPYVGYLIITAVLPHSVAYFQKHYTTNTTQGNAVKFFNYDVI